MLKYVQVRIDDDPSGRTWTYISEFDVRVRNVVRVPVVHSVLYGIVTEVAYSLEDLAEFDFGNRSVYFKPVERVCGRSEAKAYKKWRKAKEKEAAAYEALQFAKYNEANAGSYASDSPVAKYGDTSGYGE